MDDLSVWTTYIELGETAFNHGQYQIAETMLRAALKETPRSQKGVGTLGAMLENLAEIFCKQERYAKAERLYKRAIAVQEKECGKNCAAAVRLLYKMAILYAMQKRHSLSERWLRKAMEAGRESRDIDNAQQAQLVLKLVQLWHAQGQQELALRAYQDVLSMRINMKPDATDR